jgi:hypothetical protein
MVEISDDEIWANRLNEEEIHQLLGGKFSNYIISSPSNVSLLDWFPCDYICYSKQRGIITWEQVAKSIE